LNPMSGLLVACVFIAILLMGVGAAAKSAIDLAKRDADRAFWGALKMFVFLSVLTGIFVFCAFYEGGLEAGLQNLIYGRYAPFFLITFPGQMIALTVLVLAWRRRRHDRN
jgi:hypothetical protein